MSSLNKGDWHFSVLIVDHHICANIAFLFSAPNCLYQYILCEHNCGMALLQVAYGEDSLWIWRVLLNILNKQSWAGNKVLSSNFWFGCCTRVLFRCLINQQEGPQTLGNHTIKKETQHNSAFPGSEMVLQFSGLCNEKQRSKLKTISSLYFT